MTIDGYALRAVKTTRLSQGKGETLLEMELFEGRNRQIRKMCASVGLSVLRLQRIAIGALTLGDLPVGKWRKLTDSELAYLRGETKTILKK